MIRRMRRLVCFLVGALLLYGCRVDTTVHVVVAADGSGSIQVVVVADADVVGQAPGLADDLRFDDVTAAGWEVEGPVATDTGGLRVVMTHEFTSVSEATTLLASLNGAGGPLHDVTLTREVTDAAVTTALVGTLRIDGGLDAFADPAMLAALGASPYAATIASAGMRPADAVGFTFEVALPGTVTTTGTEPDGGVMSWVVPLDGSSATLDATAVQSRAAPSSGWSAVAKVAFVALVAWCIVALGFIAFVVSARRRRARRHGARSFR